MKQITWILAIIVISTLPPISAEACDCLIPNLSDAVSNSDVILYARAIRLAPGSQGPTISGSINYTPKPNLKMRSYDFVVLEEFTEDLPDTIRLYTPPTLQGCSFPFRIEKEYLVFANWSYSPTQWSSGLWPDTAEFPALVTSMCSGTINLNRAKEERDQLLIIRCSGRPITTRQIDGIPVHDPLDKRTYLEKKRINTPSIGSKVRAIDRHFKVTGQANSDLRFWFLMNDLTRAHGKN